MSETRTTAAARIPERDNITTFTIGDPKDYPPGRRFDPERYIVLSILQAIIGDAISLAAVVAVLAGIIKQFQIAASLNEIRDLLAQIKRNTQDYTPASSVGFERRATEALHHEGLHGESVPNEVLSPLSHGPEGRTDVAPLHSALMNPEP